MSKSAFKQSVKIIFRDGPVWGRVLDSNAPGDQQHFAYFNELIGLPVGETFDFSDLPFTRDQPSKYRLTCREDPVAAPICLWFEVLTSSAHEE